MHAIIIRNIIKGNKSSNQIYSFTYSLSFPLFSGSFSRLPGSHRLCFHLFFVLLLHLFLFLWLSPQLFLFTLPSLFFPRLFFTLFSFSPSLLHHSPLSLSLSYKADFHWHRGRWGDCDASLQASTQCRCCHTMLEKREEREEEEERERRVMKKRG